MNYLPLQTAPREDVKQHLPGINILKSAGWDKLDPGVQKELAEELSALLILIFIKSYKTSEIADR